MSGLANKSIVELRGIAQLLSIPDLFQKDKTQLVQAIELRQTQAVQAPKSIINQPTYDVRLMTDEPAKIGSKQEIQDMLAAHIARGLRLKFDDERWYMQHGVRTDEGTLRMPLRHIWRCAEAILL